MNLDVDKPELLDDDDDTPSPKHLHRLNRQRQRQGTLPRKGTVVEVETPITVRSLSENLGVKAADLIKKLMAKEMSVTINTGLDEATEIEAGIRLREHRAGDARDHEQAKQRPSRRNEKPRAQRIGWLPSEHP